MCFFFALLKPENIASNINTTASINTVAATSNTSRQRVKQRKEVKCGTTSSIGEIANQSDPNHDQNLSNYHNMVSMAAAAAHSYAPPPPPPPPSSIDLNNNSEATVNANASYAYANNGGAIKRGCEDVDGETEDDLRGENGYSGGLLSSSSAASMSSGRRSPPKRPKFIVTFKEMREFFNLLNEESIREFLKRDSCCLISDKVKIACLITVRSYRVLSLGSLRLIT